MLRVRSDSPLSNIVLNDEDSINTTNQIVEIKFDPSQKGIPQVCRIRKKLVLFLR